MNQTISVSGIGTAAAPPDLAILDIGVEVLASLGCRGKSNSLQRHGRRYALVAGQTRSAMPS